MLNSSNMDGKMLKQNPWKKWMFYLIVGTLISAFVVNILLLIPSPFEKLSAAGDSNGWLSFFGCCFGSIIGVSVSLYILKQTLIQNESNHQQQIYYQRTSTLYMQECTNFQYFQSQIKELRSFVKDWSLYIAFDSPNSLKIIESEENNLSDIDIFRKTFFVNNLSNEEKDFCIQFDRYVDYVRNNQIYRICIASIAFYKGDMNKFNEFLSPFKDKLLEADYDKLSACDSTSKIKPILVEINSLKIAKDMKKGMAGDESSLLNIKKRLNESIAKLLISKKVNIDLLFQKLIDQ